MPGRPDLEGRPLIHLASGCVYVSDKPVVVRTLLGSCVSACLHDPVARIGGLNHFLLPDQAGDSNSARYGFEAMELLIDECQRLGAIRSRLVARVFGGGHMLAVSPCSKSVSQKNIEFIRVFLAAANIPTVAEDLGGNFAREIYYFPDTGRTLLRRLQNENDRSKRARPDDFAFRQF